MIDAMRLENKANPKAPELSQTLGAGQDFMNQREAKEPTTCDLRDWSASDFSNIYVRFRPTLVAQAAKMLKSDFQAEEVVQDAFLYLLTALPELDSEVGVLKFLRWKTRMLCLDTLRAPELEAPFELTSESDIASDEAEPVDNLAKADDAALVNLALAKLTSRHREVLIATIYEEKSSRQVAAQLGISENALRQLTLRARASFRRALVGEAELEGKKISEILSIAAKRGASSRNALVSSVFLVVISLSIGLLVAPPYSNPESKAVCSSMEVHRSPKSKTTPGDSESWPQNSSQSTPGSEKNQIPVVNGDGGRSPELNRVGEQSSLLKIVESVADAPLSGEQPTTPLFQILNPTLAENLESSATSLTSEMGEGSLTLKSDNGLSAYISLGMHTESVIQHLSLIYEFESEWGTARITAVPLSVLEVSSYLDSGIRKVDYVATDLLFGDLDGTFGHLSESESRINRTAIIVQLLINDESKLIESKLEILPRT